MCLILSCTYRKIQNFRKIQLQGRASCDPGEKWHLQMAEDREKQGGFATGPLQAPHQLTIQPETGQNIFISFFTFFSNQGKIMSFWARLKWSNLFI